jgi:hypothetical protein
MKAVLLLLLAIAAAPLGCSKGDAGRSGAAADGDACEAYAARLEACVKKAPAETRAAHEAAINAAREIFEEKAKADDGKVALAEACKQMAEALAERPICN